MRRFVVIALLVVAGPSWADSPADELHLARYTTTSIDPDPDASNPLAVIATVRFPREQVRSVGDAIAYLLLRTGYHLDSTDSAASTLLAMPLPESHRELGPYRAQTILQLLVGEPYEVHASRVDRTVAINLRPEPRPASPSIPNLAPTSTRLHADADDGIAARMAASEPRP